MDNIELLKALFGLASAYGTIALYKYNVAQSQKARAELIEKLESAVVANRPYTACELFRLLHGFTVSFSDVAAIVNDNNASKLILALQKRRGMIRVEGGNIVYSAFWQRKGMRTFNRIVTSVLAYLTGFCALASIGLMALLSGPQSIGLLVLVIPSLTLLAIQLHDIRYDRLVDSLVQERTAKSLQVL